MVNDPLNKALLSWGGKVAFGETVGPLDSHDNPRFFMAYKSGIWENRTGSPLGK